MKQIPWILLATSCALAGCSSDGGSAGISVKAVTSTGAESATELALTDDGGADYALEAATLHLRHIELDLPDGRRCGDIEHELGGDVVCDGGGDSDKISISGPFEIDLVAGTATPNLDEILIPAGTYERIDFRVEDNAEDVSFAARAGFEHDGEVKTLDLSLDFNEDIRVERPQGIVVEPDSDLIAAFVVDNWLGGVDVGSCIDDGDVRSEGTTVFVDESSTSGNCSDIEDTIKENMKTSGQLDRR